MCACRYDLLARFILTSLLLLTYVLATCSLTKATKLTRHRVQNQWAGHIKYASLAAADAAHVRLRFGACASLPPY